MTYPTPSTDDLRAAYSMRADLSVDEGYAAAFDRWLAERDREVARNAIYSAADEFLNGHQADKPRENHRQTVPAWLLAYAQSHFAVLASDDVAPGGAG